MNILRIIIFRAFYQQFDNRIHCENKFSACSVKLNYFLLKSDLNFRDYRRNYMLQTKGYAVQSAESKFETFDFERRDVGAKDILIEIHVLRSLSFGHSPGAKRMGKLDFSDGSRTRNRRTRGANRRGRFKIQRRRFCRSRLFCRFVRNL